MDRKSRRGGALSAALFSRSETPSRRLGQSSSSCSARSKPEAKKHSIRPSPSFCHASLPTMQRLGSDLLSTVYSKTENALEGRWYELRPRKAGGVAFPS